MTRVLRILDTAGNAFPLALDEQVELYRSLVADRRILVVADDADADQVRLLTPGASPSVLLATSRSALAPVDGATRLTLPPFSEREGTELLALMLGPEAVEHHRTDAERIVRFCDGLPLGVRIAGGRLVAHPHRSIAWLADRLVVGHRRLDELTVDDLAIRTTLRSACADLSGPARAMLGRLGQVDARRFSTRLAAAVTDLDEAEVEPLLDELAAVHLAEPVHAAGRPQEFRLPGLVHAFAAELCRATADVERPRLRRASDPLSSGPDP